jgi:hypothetical protein
MKTCYTAIIGPYDDLKEPSVISEGWRYICFTDQPLKSRVWEIRPVPTGIDPQRTARKIKILFHQYISDEYSLWLDASFQINANLNDLWIKMFKAPMSAPAHPVRHYVIQEVNSCIANSRGNASQVHKQGEIYKAIDPAMQGLISSGVLFRQRTEETITLCEYWWKEVEAHSTRDQIAFAYITRNRPINRFNWDYSQSKELVYKKHLHLRH